MVTLFAMLLHGAIGIVGFIILASIFTAFGGKKEKEQEEEEAGCGCLVVLVIIGLAVFILMGQR